MSAHSTPPMPVMTGTLFRAVADISGFFIEGERRLPQFVGDPLVEGPAVWGALNVKGCHVGWLKAAVAASLERVPGQRTGEATPLQAFARDICVAPATVSRLARVHRTFSALRDERPLEELDDDELDLDADLASRRWVRVQTCASGRTEYAINPEVKAELEARRPLDPTIMRLLDDPSLSFRHFVVAACYATSPKLAKLALLEARQAGWSGAETERVLASRKKTQLIDDAGQPFEPADDDDHESRGRGIPERAPSKRLPAHTRAFTLLLTRAQYRQIAGRLARLAKAFNTQSDHETLAAVLERAEREWLAPADRGDASRDGGAVAA